MSRTTDRPLALFLPLLEGGGAERVMLTLAETFVHKGLNVDLVLVDAHHPKSVRLHQVPSGVNIVDLKASGAIHSLLPLTRYLRQQRPFGLLATLNHANIVAIWAKYLSLTDTNVVVRVANAFATEGGLKAWQRDAIPHPLGRIFYPCANAVVALAEDMAQNLIDVLHVPKKVLHVIYNPVMTVRIDELSRYPITHRWFDSGECVLLAVGRLESQKDYPTLLHAFKQVLAHRPAQLLILGEGSKRAELVSLIQEIGLIDHVELLGFVENPYPYMRQASAFVLSSIFEGFPNVLVEAMACGCPVVSTNCPSGPSEILQNGEYGKLVPIGDSTELANAIIAILDNPPDPKLLKKRVETFSPELIADQYLALMREEK